MRLKHFPISFFAMIMGMSGLTIASQKVMALGYLPFWAVRGLVGVSIASFVFFLLIYLLKYLRHPTAVTSEFKHPIKLHFFPTISISLLLLSIVILPMNQIISAVLWATGSGLHLLLTLIIVSLWMHQDNFDYKHMNPSWFIPAVGSILVPIAGIHHAVAELSWFFYQPLPEKLLPTFFILIAPPSVGFIAYVKLTGGIDGFARILFYFGLFTLLLLMVQWRIFARVKFYLSGWAYAFPSAAITIASFLMYQQT